jgi:tripartite-type tricarboxylate transporter receptor subunit TctC
LALARGRRRRAIGSALHLPHDSNAAIEVGGNARADAHNALIHTRACARTSMKQTIRRAREETMSRATAFAAGLALACVMATPIAAADYPTKPITLIIGFAPGGPSDVMSRILTKKMEEVLKQPFVIENRPGAGGSLAGTAVARAAPDGYTVLLATGSLLAINVSLYKNLGYDPEKDFEPISLIGMQTNVLYLHPSVPAKSLSELIAHAKANPGKLSFGSGGIGTPAHLAGELLKIEAKIDITHVPFRGTGPALQNVIGGHVPMAFNPPSPLLPHIQSGAIRPIAITTLARTAALPDVPTVAESGFPGFEATTWHGLVAPAGTPKDVIAALHRALMATLNDPAARKQLTELGIDLVGNSSDEFRAYIKSEIPKWAKIVQASGAKAE